MNIKYYPNDYVPNNEALIYGFQQIVLLAASVVVMPITVATALGLDRADITSLLQRTFILCGIMMILQVKWGHEFPIQHGPAGLWSASFIAMATTMPALGMSLSNLRTSLEAAMLIGGTIVLLLAAFGLMKHIAKLFTPMINGLTIMLMVIQLSQSILKGMLGINSDSMRIDPKMSLLSVFTLVSILLIMFYAKGFIKSIATFIGVILGWILAILIKATTIPNIFEYGLISLPKPFAWGNPTFDPGIIVTGIVGSLILLSMSFASVSSMASLLGEEMTDKKTKNTIFFHGLAVALTGVFSSIGFMPYASSVGVVQMTKVAAKKPIYIASVLIIIMGFITPLGALLSAIPSSVGNSALIVIFGLCFVQALSEFKNVEFNNRNNLILGLSAIIGVGIMFLPKEIFEDLPSVLSCLLSNGLIVGIITCFLLEHVLIPKEKV